YDIPLILSSVTQTDSYEGSFKERRVIIWTLTFTLKGWMFGATRAASVIKQVEVNYMIPSGPVDQATPTNTSPLVELVITPGLTVDGNPTSNSAISIDKNLIESDDNYGYIIDFQENI